MRTAIACILSVLCTLCLAAALPSHFEFSAHGDDRFAFFCGPNKMQHVTLAAERGSAYIGARAQDGVYGWAIIADQNGTSRIQVRDESGDAVTIDLLKAVRLLKAIESGEKN
jgi:hypothetical protein